MAHDVFISYAGEDKTVADAVCAKLEERRIRCWIAPRDILPGMNTAEATVDAVDESSAMVVVFSARANESPRVMREVQRAVHDGIPIIPLRIQQVEPARAMEYFLGSQHWLDALTPPLESHMNKLADIVGLLLGQKPSAAQPLVDLSVSSGSKSLKSLNHPPIKRRNVLYVAIIAAVLAVILAIAIVPGMLHPPAANNTEAVKSPSNVASASNPQEQQVTPNEGPPSPNPTISPSPVTPSPVTPSPPFNRT